MMSTLVFLFVVIILFPSLISRLIRRLKKPVDQYKKIRKQSAFNARVVEIMNSKPNSYNKVGALSIFEQGDNTGKLSLTEPDD